MKANQFILVFLLSSFFCIESVMAQPTLNVVRPMYGAGQMNLRWMPSTPGATAQIRRKTGAGAYGAWQNVGVATSHNDPIAGTAVYTYQVRDAAMPGGPWSAPSNERKSSMTRGWPVTEDASCISSESIEVLNGFNQPIRAGGNNYFHEGVDIHGEEGFTSECVKAGVGGIAFGVGGTGSNISVNIQFHINGQEHMVQYNHLDNLDAAVVNGESVAPGQKLGEIKSGIWNQECSHTHFHYWTNSANFWGSTTDPHLVYTSNTYTDPQGNTPQIADTNGDMKPVRFRKDYTAHAYFPEDTVYRETDIVAEIYDKQSSDAPWQAPQAIGYYIEYHNGSSWGNAVKSSGSPYLLVDDAQGYLQSSSATSVPGTNQTVVDWNAALESNPPETPAFYVWDQWWTFIITNTKGTNGTLSNLDSMQCWATDARMSVAADNGYTAGYARARSIDEAKFKDGRYRARIHAADYVNTATPHIKEVYVDNFRPYVKKVEIESGELNYSAEWNWGGSSLTLTDNTDMDKACGEMTIKIETSEPMKEVTITIPGLGNHTETKTSPVSNTNSTQWEFTIPESKTKNAQKDVEHEIEIDGKDLSDNSMQGFISKSNVPAADIQKRSTTGGWTPNTAPVPDNIHKFTLDTISFTLETEPASCDGNKGKITVTVDGSGDFEYSIDGGGFQSSNVFDNLDKGDYTIAVKRVGTDCEFTDDATVEEENELNVSVSGGGTFEFCTQDGPPDVTLTASASGGTAPYNYSWPGGSLTVSSSGTYTVNVTDANGCTENASVNVVVIPIVCSRDPNDMIGPPGYGEPKWVSVNDVLPYTIRFENDPEFATAPAQKVVIEHIPDVDLNLFSLKLSDFGFANLFFQVPPNSTYYTTRLNVVDSLGIYVDVTAGIDVTENKVFWIFESIDAETGLEPSDPLAGLLPVNDTITRAGEGFVTFTIQPKITSQTGDTIFAVSDIIFDLNEIIATPEIFNVIDAHPPVSQMDALPLVSEDTLLLSWTAVDDIGGCGVGYYNIYVSEDGAPYSLHFAGITDQTYPFIGVSGKQYDFFVQAADNVGNLEALKNAAETTTLVGGRTQFDLTVLLQGAYDSNGEMTTTLNTARRLLPGQTPVGNLATPTPAGQPYDREPWNYMGTEGANWTNDDYPAEAVDWVLVSFRTDTEKNTQVGMTAALLLKDGTVEIPETFALPNDTDATYIVVEHRNHIGVMTPQAINFVVGDTLTYDFRLADSYDGNGTGSGQKQLASGEWVMFAGDADQSDFPSYDVLGSDKIPWEMENGIFDYYTAPDFDMDGDVNGADKALWFDNNGVSSRVPK